MFAWRAFPGRGDASPGAFLTVPALARAGIRVAFTARAGGASAPPYDALNLSFVSGDDPGVVKANRARALGAIDAAPQSWTSGRQAHGIRVARVTDAERGRGWNDPGSTIPDTDALCTDRAGIALAVLTADCLPIVLAHPQERRLAVVHAGWRGLIGGIVEAAAAELGSLEGVEAYVGPAIGPCCYEVGADVRGAAAEALGPEVARSNDRLDLWLGARIALGRARVRSISLSMLCTRCQPGRFFSHRAGHAARQGVVAMIAP